jgi:hypothetical protein
MAGTSVRSLRRSRALGVVAANSQIGQLREHATACWREQQAPHVVEAQIRQAVRVLMVASHSTRDPA